MHLFVEPITYVRTMLDGCFFLGNPWVVRIHTFELDVYMMCCLDNIIKPGGKGVSFFCMHSDVIGKSAVMSR